MTTQLSQPHIPAFESAQDWATIDRDFLEHGVARIRGFLSPAQVASLNASFDTYIATHENVGQTTGSDSHKAGFLGANTLRIKGLAAKFDWADDILAHPVLVAWAERMMAESATSIQLATTEFIQIQPGQQRQPLHRDAGAWPIPPRGPAILVNAIIALTRFTTANGATNVVPGSHHWEVGHKLSGSQVVSAEMDAGDMVLIHGDLLHGGGTNTTAEEMRRGLSITYCAGWLRPVENNYLSVPVDIARQRSSKLQQLLGYNVYDGTQRDGILLGLYDGADPQQLFQKV
jgi:ectoine hydroxylase-related dioxygenase (phytanoyl-CoA dioxygenase family)